MDTNELKFVLKLLGCEDYRSSLAASSFNTFKGKDKICRDLGDRGLVDYSREIASVKILSPGKALLKLDPAELPITDIELKVLDKVSKAPGKVAPSKIAVSPLKAAEKEVILKTLDEKGLIEAERKMKKAKPEVWLTERGIEYLRDDYSPKKGSNPVISLDLLANYTRFLRKVMRGKSEQLSTSLAREAISAEPKSNEEILQVIQKLDRELGTDNYLPIFHLRQKLQPALSRDELDKALYHLQSKDLIELSSLQEASTYTSEQVEAGIPQNIGGPLFFISIN
jgi:DNA-binding PadR family transcriptional regulator